MTEDVADRPVLQIPSDWTMIERHLVGVRTYGFEDPASLWVSAAGRLLLCAGDGDFLTAIDLADLARWLAGPGQEVLLSYGVPA